MYSSTRDATWASVTRVGDCAADVPARAASVSAIRAGRRCGWNDRAGQGKGGRLTAKGAPRLAGKPLAIFPPACHASAAGGQPAHAPVMSMKCTCFLVPALLTLTLAACATATPPHWEKTYSSVAFSPDHALLAFADAAEIRIVEVDARR